MDARGFFLGLIAAVVLYLLWKKEQEHGTFAQIGPSAPQSSPGACAGCSGPSAAASPTAQFALPGADGQISPGTPPLNAATAAGSFYGPDGPTPWTGFLNNPTPIISSEVTVGPAVPNTPGSPTTPSNIVPTRALQPVGSYQRTGFQQRYNVVGVPRVYISSPSQTGWVM